MSIVTDRAMSNIIFQEREYSEEELVSILHPFVKEWFFSKFKKFAPPQKRAVMEIHNRTNVLVSAPTGSGKTLTAFLSILNELVYLADAGNLEDRIYALYISPLKALNNDIFFNLETPLKDIKEIAKQHGKELNIRVAVRTGDTTPYEKQKMLKNPPHILVTTPESLAIVLSSAKFKEHLTQLWWVIVDEIHSLAENKRGTHLSLSLERLQRLSNFTRIGLSATVAPLDEIAKFLVGFEGEYSRKCKIIDIQYMKNIDLKVLCPVKNLMRSTHEQRDNALHEMLHEKIQSHKTTLIFTNTRAATERIVHELKERYPSHYKKNGEETIDLIGAHHGSLSKSSRLKIEQQLREGKLKCVVCSTSLELGIDIGYIDLVLLLGSPKSVARALQRAGRAGHKLHEISKARFIVLDRDDLVECSLMLKAAVEKKIDRIHIPVNALDVLAQQIFGTAIEDTISEKELLKLVKSSYCYRNLKNTDFNSILSYLAGEYVTLESRNIYAKIWRNEGKIGRRGKSSRVIYMTNIGTIPDSSSIKVKIGEQVIGSFDEDFLEALKPRDRFVLGGNVYEFRFSRGQTAQVASAEGRKPTIPSWVSEMLPLSFDLAVSIQKFRKYMEEKIKKKESKKDIIGFIEEYCYIDGNAANSIYEYFKEQYNYASIPHIEKMIIEKYTSEGETSYIFHSLFGRRVNDVLSRAVAYAISRQQKRSVRVAISDNGFTINCSKIVNPKSALKLLKSEQLRKVMEIAIETSQILARRFRHCAARSLMILRQYNSQRKSVGKQQVSSMILKSALKRISNDFSILKEARREVLEDKMDIDNATQVLKWIEEGKIKVEEIQTDLPSPFAFNLALQGYSDILKMEDKVEFLRRMHAEVLARIALKGSSDKSYLEEVKRNLEELEKEKAFSYDEYWDEKEEEKVEEKIEAREKLYHDFIFAAKRIRLDPQIEYDIARLIDGDDITPRRETMEWLKGLFSGPVPKIWSDDISKFLKEKFEAMV